MTYWTLILYIYAGAMSNTDSVTLQTIPGFTSEQTCKAAGEGPKSLVKMSTKEYRFACVEVK